MFRFRAMFLRFEDPAGHFLQAVEKRFGSQGPASANVPADVPEAIFRQRTVQEGIPIAHHRK